MLPTKRLRFVAVLGLAALTSSMSISSIWIWAWATGVGGSHRIGSQRGGGPFQRSSMSQVSRARPGDGNSGIIMCMLFVGKKSIALFGKTVEMRAILKIILRKLLCKQIQLSNKV